MSDLGVEIALSYAMVIFSGKANTSIHGLEEDNTAGKGQPVITQLLISDNQDDESCQAG